MKQPYRPVIALTLGDPAGIGPEIAAKALTQSPALPDEARVIVIGPANALRAALKMIDADTVLTVAHDAEEINWDAAPPHSGDISILEPARKGEWPEIAPGIVSAKGGEAAFQAVWLAARLAMEGRFDAICTAPLHKQALHLAGHIFPGHTEILAEAAGGKRVVMLLEGGGLRVALATIHTPLSNVPRAITIESLLSILRIVRAALVRDWGIAQPRLAVAGLNPHAGEGGILGSEEERIIVPAIEAARAEGIAASGPWPGDTVFNQMLHGSFDAVLAMYHDQGLSVLKTLAFDEGVNITLGLPFIRTSPDHGTAMDIAGKNQANPRSLLCALRSAASLARMRRAHGGA